MCVCVYMRMHVCTRVYVYMYICIYVCMYACIYVCIYLCMSSKIYNNMSIDPRNWKNKRQCLLFQMKTLPKVLCE